MNKTKSKPLTDDIPSCWWPVRKWFRMGKSTGVSTFPSTPWIPYIHPLHPLQDWSGGIWWQDSNSQGPEGPQEPTPPWMVQEPSWQGVSGWEWPCRCNCTPPVSSLFSRMCMGSRPTSASVPPVGEVLKQPVIHSATRHWTANSCLMVPLSLAPCTMQPTW